MSNAWRSGARFQTRVAPPDVLVTRYPVRVEPPSVTGGVQVRWIDLSCGRAVKPLGRSRDGAGRAPRWSPAHSTRPALLAVMATV